VVLMGYEVSQFWKRTMQVSFVVHEASQRSTCCSRTVGRSHARFVFCLPLRCQRSHDRIAHLWLG